MLINKYYIFKYILYYIFKVCRRKEEAYLVVVLLTKMTRTQKQTEDFVHIIKYIINTKILNQQDKIYICGV